MDKDAAKDALELQSHKHYESPKPGCKSEGKVKETQTDGPSYAFLCLRRLELHWLFYGVGKKRCIYE